MSTLLLRRIAREVACASSASSSFEQIFSIPTGGHTGSTVTDGLSRLQCRHPEACRFDSPASESPLRQRPAGGRTSVRHWASTTVWRENRANRRLCTQGAGSQREAKPNINSTGRVAERVWENWIINRCRARNRAAETVGSRAQVAGLQQQPGAGRGRQVASQA